MYRGGIGCRELGNRQGGGTPRPAATTTATLRLIGVVGGASGYGRHLGQLGGNQGGGGNHGAGE